MVVILNGSLIHNKKDLCSEYATHDSIFTFTTRYHTSHKHRHIDNRFPLFTYTVIVSTATKTFANLSH